MSGLLRNRAARSNVIDEIDSSNEIVQPFSAQ
jgi:hypothetical protein